MQVRVLGKSPSWQDGGGACSGYLIREGGFSLLLDCGSGVFAKLREVQDYLDVDAIVISHLHPDHMLDLIPFSFAMNYSPRRQSDVVAHVAEADEPARPQLHAPTGAREMFLRLAGSLRSEGQMEEAFVLTEYGASSQLTLGPFSLRFCEVPHFTQAFACEISSAGRRFTFGADCAPSDALVAFASGTDLLMTEATLEHPETEGIRGHMTPLEAGQLARRASVERLVLTHYSDEVDSGWIHSEGVRGFGGEVSLAHEGAEYAV